eukprot:Em0014g40a
MGLAYSSEYQALKRNSAAICKRVLDRKDVQWLNQQLCGRQIVSSDENDSTLSLDTRERARNLVQKVERTVRQNPQKYHQLVQVLKEKESDYRPVLEALSRSYAATWRHHFLLFLGVLALLITLKVVLAYSRNFISSLHSENCYYPSLPIHTLTAPPEHHAALYGREGEALDLVSRLKSNTSAINIYGPPGIGKSALASIVAQAFQDGGFAVYRADMGLVCNVEEVAVEVLKAAGWHGAARAGDPVAEMVEWAGNLDEYALLVLDNCDDFLTGSKNLVETVVESLLRVGVCLLSPQTCGDMIRLDQRKQKFHSLLSGLLRAPGHMRVVMTTTAPDEVAMQTLMRAGVRVTQFLVHPLDVRHSVSLLQHYSPNLNTSIARRLANYVGNFPQALVAIATTVQGGVNASQNMDSNVEALMSKLEERDVYGFLIMTRLDSALGLPTLAYRMSYNLLADDVKKCGRILAQSNTRVFTPKIAQYWLQSFAFPE